jgi:NAD(P)-dependent dehydrogenase (short-subunit alcohol dehydrogenase family)
MDGLLGEGKPKFRANLIAPTYVETNMTRGMAQYVKQTGATIKVAQVSDATHVVLRMIADENVRGKFPYN